MKRTVVIGYDHSRSSDRALDQAGREAAWRGATVTVVNAFHWVAATTPVAYIPMNVETSLETAAKEVAATGVDLLRRRYPDLTVESRVIAGPTADAIAEAARDAEVLVLGNRGRGGFAGLLLGSVSMRTLTLASCPTMIVRGTERDPADLVVLAVDIEEPADEVVDFAFAEAAARAAGLRVVSACDVDWAEVDNAPGPGDDLAQARTHIATELHAKLADRLRPWQTAHPDVPLTIDLVDGAPSAVLTKATETADLIVVGGRRRGDTRPGMRLGPVANTLVHHADCPVVVVPRG